MFSESADYYDLIYRQFKDYPAEAAAVARLIRARAPSADRILDVACGTGWHAHSLATAHGFEVDGIDIEPRFVALAGRNHPEGRFTCADMADFDLDRRYDAVVCLFSAIGYVRTRERLAGAVRCFARHVVSGGVVVVEPWFAPGEMTPGHTTMCTGESEGVKVCRASLTEIDGTVSRIRFEYLIASAEGIARAREIHELGLFTRREMLEAFQRASLGVEHDPEGLSGRGLYVARAAGG